MRTIALNNAALRTTCATLALALFISPATAQLRPGAAAERDAMDPGPGVVPGPADRDLDPHVAMGPGAGRR